MRSADSQIDISVLRQPAGIFPNEPHTYMTKIWLEEHHRAAAADHCDVVVPAELHRLLRYAVAYRSVHPHMGDTGIIAFLYKLFGHLRACDQHGCLHAAGNILE